MKRKLAGALAGCAALVFALSACGGGDDSSEETEAWAKEVCDQLRPEVERIRSANVRIAEASEGDASPEEIQEADSAAFQEMSEAYAALAGIVQDAGEPPVDDGARLRRNAVAELNGISESYGELKDTVDGLDTSDPAEFADGLTGMTEQMAELGRSGDDAIGELQSGELGEAMAEQPGCQAGDDQAPGEDATGEDATGGAESSAAE